MPARRAPLRGGLLLVGLLLAAPSSHTAAKSSPGFAGPASRPHFPRDREVDFRHLRLDLAFDWDRKWVGGEAAFTFTPIAAPVRTVHLDATDLRVREVRSGGASVEFTVAGDHLVVDLGREVPPGEEGEFSIAYEANPRKGLFFAGTPGDPARPPHIWSQGEAEDNHHWFPCYDYPNDRITWESILTVPAAMSALGNGELVEVRENREAGTRTFHYRQEVPAVTYLVSVAAGEFDVVREEWNDVPVEYWVPKGTPEETALRSFGRTSDMLAFFSERIGVPYPYPKYAQVTVSDFTFGGMENLSATTLTLDTLHPDRVEPEASSQGLVAHELAHQWFGDLLTCRDWSHAWLNEGFATYFEALYREHRDGPDEFQYRMLRYAREYFEEDRDRYRRSIVENVYTDPFDLFDDHLYPKGAWTLHMLRAVAGEDLFWKTIRAYAERHSRGIVTTEDLRKAFEAVTGRSLEWFFDEWYHHGGHPEFRLRQEWREEGGTLRLKVEQVQKADDLTPVFRMPVRIAFAGDGWSREERVEIREPIEEFAFALPGPPLLTRFDAGQYVLKTLEFERTREELDYQLRHDPDVAGRIWAAEQLGKRAGDGRAGEILEEALRREPFWGVRAAIAEALGKLRLQDRREALVETLVDPDSRVRSSALGALGRYREDPDAARSIRAAFESEENDYVRAAAVKAYAEAAAPDAFDFLRAALPLPSYRELVAEAACEGLARLRNPEAIPLLREEAKAGGARHRRVAAIRALGRLARLEGPESEAAVDLLLHLLADESVFARQAAIQGLGDARASRAVPALREAADTEWDARLRRAAQRSIAAIRKAREGGADLEALRERVDRLEEETRLLREGPGREAKGPASP